MKCKNCGKEIERHSKYCKYCGATVGTKNEKKKGKFPKWIVGVLTGIIVIAAVGAIVVMKGPTIKNLVLNEKKNKSNTEDSIGMAESLEQIEELVQTSYQEEVLTQYQEKLDDIGMKNLALLYVDEDEIPELLYCKDERYHIWTFRDGTVEEVEFCPQGVEANIRDKDSETGASIHYIEYIPKKNCIRLHHRRKEDMVDTYVDLNGDVPKAVLETNETSDYKWVTYCDGKQVDNEVFNEKRISLGFDQLQSCNMFYESVEDAYKNIDKTFEEDKEIYEQFLDGKIDAITGLDYVSDDGRIHYVKRSYSDYKEYFIYSENEVNIEYKDFDNDGKEELIVNAPMDYSTTYFDVIGDKIYEAMFANGTADVPSILEQDGYNLVERSDLTHAGRQTRNLYRYDSCNAIVDQFNLTAEYWSNTLTDWYDCNCDFYYRGERITIEEYLELMHQYYNCGEELSNEEKERNHILVEYEKYVKKREEKRKSEEEEYYGYRNARYWYQLAYLDEDEIPELFIGYGTSQLENDSLCNWLEDLDILAYVDGKVVSFREQFEEKYPVGNEIRYIPGEGKLFQHVVYDNGELIGIYTYKNGNFQYEGEMSEEWHWKISKYDYLVNGKKVKKTEYQKQGKAFKNAEVFSWEKNAAKDSIWFLEEAS